MHWESEQHEEQRYQATCTQLAGGNCHTHNASSMYRVSFSFLPNGGGGGRMRLYGLLGGQANICVQSMWQTTVGGSGGMLPRENFGFEPFIGRKLVESGTVFTQT